MEYVCEFCQWKGCIELGETICPHCSEDGFLVPSDEWVTPEERPENLQVVYSAAQELNDDTPRIKRK